MNRKFDHCVSQKDVTSCRRDVRHQWSLCLPVLISLLNDHLPFTANFCLIFRGLKWQVLPYPVTDDRLTFQDEYFQDCSSLFLFVATNKVYRLLNEGTYALWTACLIVQIELISWSHFLHVVIISFIFFRLFFQCSVSGWGCKRIIYFFFFWNLISLGWSGKLGRAAQTS